MILVPIGEFPMELLDSLSKRAGIPLGPQRVEPAGAWNPSRSQYDSNRLLAELKAQYQGEVMGATACDLFIPVLTFVFGQAQLRGRAAVISLARLRPEFHGLRPDPQLVARRALKEAVHEVGHTFGLVHCLDRRCPMALSLGLDDLDFKTATPCASCAALLRDSLAMSDRRGRPSPTGARP